MDKFVLTRKRVDTIIDDKIAVIERSSAPYQFLLYFNGWFFVLFFHLEIAVFIWKAVSLPYESGTLAAEFILIFILTLLVALQIHYGKRGNLTERVTSVVVSLLWIIPVFFVALYFLIWQTYVLYLEVVIIATEMAFIALELIFGIISSVTFARATQ